MQTKQCKVIVIESQEIVREAVSSRIAEECNVEVIAKTGDGYSAVRICRQAKPDIIILDLTITHPDGMDTLRRLHESCPDARVVVVSHLISATQVFHALSRGVVAFVPRHGRGIDYVNAVNAAIDGFTYLPKEVFERFLSSRLSLNKTGNIFGLSAREIEILEACSSGLTTKQVAANLNISVRTVETHRHSIYKKTECRSLEELSSVMSHQSA